MFFDEKKFEILSVSFEEFIPAFYFESQKYDILKCKQVAVKTLVPIKLGVANVPVGYTFAAYIYYPEKSERYLPLFNLSHFFVNTEVKFDSISLIKDFSKVQENVFFEGNHIQLVQNAPST